MDLAARDLDELIRLAQVLKEAQANFDNFCINIGLKSNAPPDHSTSTQVRTRNLSVKEKIIDIFKAEPDRIFTPQVFYKHFPEIPQATIRGQLQYLKVGKIIKKVHEGQYRYQAVSLKRQLSEAEMKQRRDAAISAHAKTATNRPSNYRQNHTPTAKLQAARIIAPEREKQLSAQVLEVLKKQPMTVTDLQKTPIVEIKDFYTLRRITDKLMSDGVIKQVEVARKTAAGHNIVQQRFALAKAA